jgi:hypothetical protein
MKARVSQGHRGRPLGAHRLLGRRRGRGLDRGPSHRKSGRRSGNPSWLADIPEADCAWRSFPTVASLGALFARHDRELMAAREIVEDHGEDTAEGAATWIRNLRCADPLCWLSATLGCPPACPAWRATRPATAWARRALDSSPFGSTVAKTVRPLCSQPLELWRFRAPGWRRRPT